MYGKNKDLSQWMQNPSYKLVEQSALEEAIERGLRLKTKGREAHTENATRPGCTASRRTKGSQLTLPMATLAARAV
jgi:hypothetical protein